MSTFAQLSNSVRLHFKAPIDKIAILREAENIFIEETKCTTTFTQINTENENGGVLTYLYDLPSDYVHDIRLDWKGTPLKPLPNRSDIQLFYQSNEVVTGYPLIYWIEASQIHLYPQPSSHGIISLWYTNYNTDSDSESPIIPAVEQRKLNNFLMATLLEMDNKEQRSIYYLTKWENDIESTTLKYDLERNKQDTIRNEYDYEKYHDIEAGYGGNDLGVTVLNTFVWNKVELVDTPVEQLFTVGSGELTLANLDSSQSAIPLFTGNINVDISSPYQDRDVYLSTTPYITGGAIKFGVKLATAGAAGTPYCDILVRQL